MGLDKSCLTCAQSPDGIWCSKPSVAENIYIPELGYFPMTYNFHLCSIFRKMKAECGPNADNWQRKNFVDLTISKWCDIIKKMKNRMKKKKEK